MNDKQIRHVTLFNDARYHVKYQPIISKHISLTFKVVNVNNARSLLRILNNYR